MMSDHKLVSIKEIQQKSLLKKFDCGIEKLNEFLSRYAINIPRRKRRGMLFS